MTTEDFKKNAQGWASDLIGIANRTSDLAGYILQDLHDLDGGDTPSPQPPAPSANPYDFDISKCVLAAGDDIRGWPNTSEITRVALGRGELCTEHTKYGSWPNRDLDLFPPGNPVWGNQWLFARMEGKWYMGVGHWMRDSQQCKGMAPAENIGGPNGLFYRPDWEPLYHWRPTAGEVFGVAVSTVARVGYSARVPGPYERSNVVLVEFPKSNEGGDLTPVWREPMKYMSSAMRANVNDVNDTLSEWREEQIDPDW
jgi:hypothetical protein